MKNTIGESFAVTIFGESHGPYVGCVIDGIAPGIQLDLDLINHYLDLRRPAGKISTARVEADQYQIISGYVNGYTTGTPLTVLIPNTSTKSSDYDSLKNVPRPSHADYTATLKYHGFQDARGGGHFSGRITSAIVFAGAIAIQILNQHGISIGSHIARCAGIEDDEMTSGDIERMNSLKFATVSEEKGKQMLEAAEKATSELDSVGGVVETIIHNLDGGIGEPYFDTLEGVLAKLLFAVPAVKGVEFGKGFDIADLKGSEANDQYTYENGEVTTLTNHSGGINGGISNGNDIVVRTAIKPTPSIFKKQQSVNLLEKENTELEIKGRHDPAIVHRARVVIDCSIALGLVDMLSLRYGTDWQGK